MPFTRVRETSHNKWFQKGSGPIKMVQ
ncbi:hypothetical protein NITGR_250053 [Nitrospina gracilis 3/211]|uniref:Uncharacterized protein n=1 Tax=Nitrospina gracilis (strain 3/211) TaxID=1266370 RepID=M1YI60_NITG3|nr:hypothetical protein NITGR_250053 [Nitrospina gracilis 3/211]